MYECTKTAHGKWRCWKERLFRVVMDVDIHVYIYVWISDLRHAVDTSTNV